MRIELIQIEFSIYFLTIGLAIEFKVLFTEF